MSANIQRRGGFTLVELMLAAGLFGLVAAGAIGLYLFAQRMWYATTLDMQMSRDSSLALNRLVYGVGTNHGLRASSGVRLVPDADTDGWRLVVSNEFTGTRWVDYDQDDGRIFLWQNTNAADSRLLIGENIARATIVTNGGRIQIELVCMRQRGRLRGSNTVATVVSLRNN